jgi:predicted nucleic-acid-binding protein
MIALDTNILVRYFIAADDAETALATDLIENTLSPETQGFVAAITLCEIIWVLRNRYKFGYDAQASVVKLMLNSPQLMLEHEGCASAAIDRRHADIADAMIHHIGENHGCSQTLTLDKKFARIAGVELLA